MTSERREDERPPAPPEIDRRLRLSARQLIGLPLIALLPALSLADIFSERRATAEQGHPTVIVRRGRFLTDNMKRELVTPADVFTEMHKSGLEELRQVRWAILEVGGKISVMPTGGNEVTESEDKKEVA